MHLDQSAENIIIKSQNKVVKFGIIYYYSKRTKIKEAYFEDKTLTIFEMKIGLVHVCMNVVVIFILEFLSVGWWFYINLEIYIWRTN